MTVSPTVAAGFDWARKLPDPGFRTWVRSHGLISDGADPVLMAVPSTTVAEVLSRLDEVCSADPPPPVRQVWLAVADGDEPYGFRLLRIGGQL